MPFLQRDKPYFTTLISLWYHLSLDSKNGLKRVSARRIVLWRPELLRIFASVRRSAGLCCSGAYQKDLFITCRSGLPGNIIKGPVIFNRSAAHYMRPFLSVFRFVVLRYRTGSFFELLFLYHRIRPRTRHMLLIGPLLLGYSVSYLFRPGSV